MRTRHSRIWDGRPAWNRTGWWRVDGGSDYASWSHSKRPFVRLKYILTTCPSQENTLSFLKECAGRNISNFNALADQLNVEEMMVVQRALTNWWRTKVLIDEISALWRPKIMSFLAISLEYWYHLLYYSLASNLLKFGTSSIIFVEGGNPKSKLALSQIPARPFLTTKWAEVVQTT